MHCEKSAANQMGDRPPLENERRAPGVARAFALRAEVCRFAPQAPLSFLTSRSLHPEVNKLPMKKIALRSLNLHNTAFAFGKVTGVIKHLCVHYRQKKKSKEKRAPLETST